MRLSQFKERLPPQSVRFSSTMDSWLKNLAATGRGRKQALSMSADSLLAVISVWLAYSLRHGEIFIDLKSTWYLFVLLPILTVCVFSALGVYRWVIRSSNQRLYRQLVKGCIVSGLLLMSVIFLFPPDRSNPRSLIVIYSMILIISTVVIRAIWKSFFDTGSKGEPIAVYGAGSGGQQLVSLLSMGRDFRPVVFIDDDPLLIGTTLSGFIVLDGASDDLRLNLKRHDICRVVLAMPSISASEYQKNLRKIDDLGFPALTMPSVVELMSGKARVDQIRDVSIGDILGRSEVSPNLSLMSMRVKSKVVLVTGGGGSIGSEVCRQVMNLRPAKLIILDNCEANLYHLMEEFKCLESCLSGIQPELLPVLGSVTDKRLALDLMAKNNVNTIFHAAAYKHVPIVESNPSQGVDVNIFGTLALLDAAIESSVTDFLLISTDKAVRPTNVMGATKRVAELILQAKSKMNHETRISMVRFGNVLGSSGSVVPKFKKQIQSGGPITLTHSDITRYFMTIPEAAQLVLQACSLAKGGDVFVLDMGHPVRIEELAVSMVRLFGKKLRRDTGKSSDIEIVIEGLRPGEKLYEELFISGNCHSTEVKKILSAVEFWMPWNKLHPILKELRGASQRQESEKVREIVMSLAFAGELDDTLPGIDAQVKSVGSETTDSSAFDTA